MRILHVLESFYPGSINKRLRKVQDMTRDKNLEHFFLALQERRIAGQRPVLVGKCARAIDDMRNEIIETKPDVIDLHDFVPPDWLEMCKEYAPTVLSVHFAPVIPEEHETYRVRFLGEDYAISYPVDFSEYVKNNIGSFDYIICLSESVRKTLIRLGAREEKLLKFPPFLESSVPPAFPVRPTIIYVGRLDPRKGTHLLPEIVSQLRTPGWELRIAGTGDFKFIRSLMRKVRMLKLETRVSFLGHLSGEDLAEVYRSAKVSVFTSLLAEGLGYSPMEAIMYGIPMVSFDIGGSEEWLIDGYNGFKISGFDTAEFSKALDRLLGDDETFKEFRNNTLEFREKFAIDAQIDRVCEIYRIISDNVML